MVLNHDNAGASALRSKSDSVPSISGLGLDSRNNSGNTADEIAAESKRPNDVNTTQEQSIGESDEEGGGSDNEMSDENAAEDEENE